MFFGYQPAAYWGAGVLALAVISAAQAGEPGAQSPDNALGVRQELQALDGLKTLQTIKSGLWELSSSMATEGASDAQPSHAAPPEQGCITAQAMAEDLQEFLRPSQAGQACQGSLVLNEDAHSVLHIVCASAGENEPVFKAPPAILEITRASSEQFTVTSTMSAPGKPTLVMKQDYKYLGACPM